MPRYAPPPPPPERPPRDPNESSVTKWSLGRKALSIVGAATMVAAFVFNFLPLSSSDHTRSTTTVPAPTTAPPAPTTTLG